jgi:hypothetical protein
VDSNSLITVGFIGGPYDGCVRTVTQRALAGDIEMPLSRNVLQILTGDPVGGEASIRLVARYRLLMTGHGLRFRFFGFRRVSRDEEKSLGAWHHAMLAVWRAATNQQRPTW